MSYSMLSVVAWADAKRAEPTCMAVTQDSQVSSLSASGSTAQRRPKVWMAEARVFENHEGSLWRASMLRQKRLASDSRTDATFRVGNSCRGICIAVLLRLCS